MGKFPRGVVWRLSVKVLLSLHSTGQFEMLSLRHSLTLLHPEAQYPSIFFVARGLETDAVQFTE